MCVCVGGREGGVFISNGCTPGCVQFYYTFIAKIHQVQQILVQQILAVNVHEKKKKSKHLEVLMFKTLASILKL